eukprot:6201378-Pleurochrysis_carterae.AAC.1
MPPAGERAERRKAQRVDGRIVRIVCEVAYMIGNYGASCRVSTTRGNRKRNRDTETPETK